MPPARSFISTVRQVVPWVALGLTQASTVTAEPPRNRGLSFTVTQPEPEKEIAPPYLPAVDQVPLVTVPVLPFPVASAAVVPEVSLKFHAATGRGRLLSTVTVTGVAVAVAPELSSTRAPSACGPAGDVVLFQVAV